MTRKTDIVQFRITLDDVQPLVMRRVAVRLRLRLDRLHAVIQAAMGWTDSHLWEFRTGSAGWGLPDPDWGDGPLDARKVTLGDVLEDVGRRSLKYLYDFGDGWEHTVKIERIFSAVPGLSLPFLLEAKGRCPPEDIGGPAGFADYLAAIRDPGHKRHDEFKRWYDPDFDPDVVDVRAIEAALDELAKRWSSRSKSGKRTP